MSEPKLTQRFNLSDWALSHQTLVLYIMLVLTITGLLTYTKLGQSEDPRSTSSRLFI